MTDQRNSSRGSILPALATAGGLSLAGGVAVGVLSSDLGYGVTAFAIGLVIGLAIYALIARSARSG